MLCIADWWDSPSNNLGLPDQQDFDGDMPIFEIGCYTYFRLDLWFFMNEIPNKLRETIMLYISSAFIDLFQKEISLNNAGNLFDNRQEIYSSMLKQGEELPIESFHLYLVQFILKTKNNKHPELIDTKNFPIDLDFTNTMSIKMNVFSYEKHMIPSILQSVQNTLSVAAKHAST